MSRVLILYGIAEGLSTYGVATDVIQAGTLDPALYVYDGIIVAASIHAGRYQKAVEQWVRAHTHEFGARPTAFVSVCLAVLQKSDPKVRAELAAIVTGFETTTGWQPPMVKQVAGALLYTRYNIFKQWIMKRIVAKAGGDTDVSRDYDYTDWADVRAFADEFRRLLAAAAA
ncbi:MAG: protoporphyrinogen oxidase [Cyanobacteria bacterium]|nr:protoporphyrinogen oxidase [Cyanobacteriota bacterium]